MSVSEPAHQSMCETTDVESKYQHLSKLQQPDQTIILPEAKKNLANICAAQVTTARQRKTLMAGLLGSEAGYYFFYREQEADYFRRWSVEFPPKTRKDWRTQDGALSEPTTLSIQPSRICDVAGALNQPPNTPKCLQNSGLQAY